MTLFYVQLLVWTPLIKLLSEWHPAINEVNIAIVSENIGFSLTLAILLGRLFVVFITLVVEAIYIFRLIIGQMLAEFSNQCQCALLVSNIF